MKSSKKDFLTRLSWLKKVKWEQDIEALKQLNTATENASKAYVNDNLLFAKLLCDAIKTRN
jgi:archaellum biogenesis ATPase FlaH